MGMTNQDLRKAGLKVTLPRIKILELLERAAHGEHHLSAEEIHRTLLLQGEDVGLATVYRVLNQFEEAGIIEQRQFEGNHKVFELRQDDHHDHIVCQRCGKVIEFTNEIIELEQQKVAAQLGFTLTGHQLNLYGLCNQPDCEAPQSRQGDVAAH